MFEFKFDLYCYFNVFDGLLLLEEVVVCVQVNGVGVWVLIDYDEVGGVVCVWVVVCVLGMEYVVGVEILVIWVGYMVYIVGLCIDEINQVLVDGLVVICNGCEWCVCEIVEVLECYGIGGVYEGVLKYVGNFDLILCMYFVCYLVECGICCDIKEVFVNYFIEGKFGYVLYCWVMLEELVCWICGVGGVVVIVYLGCYKYIQIQFGVLFDEFK